MRDVLSEPFQRSYEGSAGSRVVVAAVDLGATSGRVMVGVVEGGVVELHPIARFLNIPVRTADGLHWNVLDLYRNVVDGLRVAARDYPELASIGIDSWAVDYALMRGGRMLGTPFHYRDERNSASVAQTHAVVGAAELYGRNGLQHLPFTTIFQLAADADFLPLADTLLLIPDLFAFWLTGHAVSERTNASTTGLLSVATGEWDVGLAERLGISASLLPPLVAPGDVIGTLSPLIAADLRTDASVVAVGSHDTASAVAAVPAADARFAYISCGTWGLVGLELQHPVLTDASRKAGFTNERGLDGTVRFLHNVMGMWLLNETVRWWERSSMVRSEERSGGANADAAVASSGARSADTGAAAVVLAVPDSDRTVSDETVSERAALEGTADLAALVAEAAALDEHVDLFDPNDPSFLAPDNMPSRIEDWLRARGLSVPTSRIALVRCIIESLAAAFADTVARAVTLAEHPIDVVHIVGGGSQNELLCQLVADRLRMPVLAGPLEATAIGNVLVQAQALGAVEPGLAALRAVVAHSYEPTRYEPR